MYIIKIDFATPTYDEMMRMRYEILMAPHDLDWEEEELYKEENLSNYGLFDHDMQLLGAYQYSSEVQEDKTAYQLQHIFIKSESNATELEELLRNHFIEISSSFSNSVS